MATVTNLVSQPIEGRLDVAAARAVERLCGLLESRYGLKDLAANVMPEVEEIIKSHVPAKKVKLPPELKLVLKLLWSQPDANDSVS